METPLSDNSNVATDAVQIASPSARSQSKFMYAGGTRPLEGYTLKRGVGQGGFGEIYYALSDAGKEVALKLIRRNLDVELRGIRQCLNLKHPNLLSLFDIRQDENGDTWVVMEYVSGLSLQESLENHPHGLPVEEALAWMHGICAAMAYLHDHGIVHRDLKPGNIFSDEGVVKVGDYGLSKFISCSRRSGHTESIGTVHYMAPEVANGRYGKEIDVYALGIIFYEMLTGRVPFEGESVGEVLMKHLTAQADVSLLPEPYKTLIAKAVEKDPEKRFSSAGDMLLALPPCPHSLPGTNRLPQNSSTGGNATLGQDQTLPMDKPLVGPIVDEEPIWLWVCVQARKLAAGWRRTNTVGKIAITLSLAVGVMFFWEFLLPITVWVCIAYGIYRLGRWIALSLSKPAPSSPPSWARKTIASAPRTRLPPLPILREFRRLPRPHRNRKNHIMRIIEIGPGAMKKPCPL